MSCSMGNISTLSEAGWWQSPARAWWRGSPCDQCGRCLTSRRAGSGRSVGVNRCPISSEVNAISPCGGRTQARSVATVTARKPWDEHREDVQRCQEVRRWTWCSSRPATGTSWVLLLRERSICTTTGARPLRTPAGQIRGLEVGQPVSHRLPPGHRSEMAPWEGIVRRVDRVCLPRIGRSRVAAEPVEEAAEEIGETCAPG